MAQDRAKIHPLFSVVPPLEVKQEFSPEDYSTDVAVCPLCRGTGFEVVAGKGARACECRRRKAQEKLADSARIPRRYEKCHFTNYQRKNMLQGRAYQLAFDLTMHYPQVERGILFMGSVGIGKTHLAVSILHNLLEKNVSCLFYEFGSLLKEIQNSYNPISQTSESSVLQPIYDAEVLVLDELGASKPTDWVRDTMMQIINTRYNDKKLTIFTTNYLDTRRATEETLEDRIGTRLRSRIYEMCQTLTIEGEDFRKNFDKSFKGK
ncbi:MAG: ATP-binding protein [Pyrinomonadaceae bacterium]|nr:ATP-binding protein [Pyrinomonadaceae bacterium]